MRRRIPTLIVTTAFLIAGCSGGDDDDAANDTAETTDTSDTTTAGTDAGSTPPATIDPDLLLPQECADVPDPDVYIEGAVPPIIPPCTVPDELVVHTLRDGVGDPAEDGDTVIVDYTGMIIGSGEVFDTSYTRGVPLDFPLGRGGVIDGWDQGLVGARAGSLLRLDIPTELAYADTPPGDQIQPGDALSFNVEVRAVVPSVTAEDAPLSLQVEPSVGAIELTTTDIVVGEGPAIELGQTAVVHMLLVRGDNEVVLFNTWANDDPLQIIMEEGQTLPGIFQGLQGATVGSLRVMAMPPELAFGEAGETGLGLPAATDLIVVAEIVGVY
jgi:FKBP-type peptidyl-prolyl cis-trans isomerase